MTIVKTKFSTYEINQDAKLIRRLLGQREPTKRQGQDLVWQPYHDLGGPEVGYPMLIQYSADSTKATITSPVVEVDGAWAAE